MANLAPAINRRHQTDGNFAASRAARNHTNDQSQNMGGGVRGGGASG